MGNVSATCENALAGHARRQSTPGVAEEERKRSAIDNARYAIVVIRHSEKLFGSPNRVVVEILGEIPRRTDDAI